MIFRLLAIILLSASAHAAPPNILFAIADDWGPHAGAYGTPWVKTPAFDRVAREGLLFKNAYTPNAKCAPSRACILTGRNSWQLKEAANHICYFPPEFKGWCEALGEHGWFTGYTVKGWGPGVAKDADGKPRAMTGRAFNARKLTPQTSRIGGADHAANFTDFPRVPGYWPDNDTVRHDMLDYALEVGRFDTHLGRMLAEPEKRGRRHHERPRDAFPALQGKHLRERQRHPARRDVATGIAKPGCVVADFTFSTTSKFTTTVCGATAHSAINPLWTSRTNSTHPMNTTPARSAQDSPHPAASRLPAFSLV
jgi:hypothetical protein